MNASKETTGEGFTDHTAAHEAQHKARHDADAPKAAGALFELLRQGHDQHAHPNVMAVIEHAMNATRKYCEVRTALGGQLEYIRRAVDRAQRELAETGRN